MKDPQKQFVDYARKHGEGTVAGNPSATNRAYDHIVAAMRELRKTPDRGEAFLLHCLQSSDDSVVAWAASYLLSFREHEAAEALERIAASGTKLTAFGAEMTLQEWRAGRLVME